MSSIAKLCSFNSICKKSSECKFSHIQGVCTFCLQGKCNKKDCTGKAVQVVDQSKGIYSFNNQQFSFHSISAKKEDEKKYVVSPLTVGKTAKTSSKKKFVKKLRYSDKLKADLGEAIIDFSNNKPQKLIILNKKIIKAKLGLTKELTAAPSPRNSSDDSKVDLSFLPNSLLSTRFLPKSILTGEMSVFLPALFAAAV